jgi:hypothetical protein
MNYFLFSHPFRNGTRVVLLLAILVLSFGYGGTSVAYAAPPVHDDFNSAKTITTIEYHDPVNQLSFINTTEATPSDTVPNGVVGDPNNFLCEDETGSLTNTLAGFASVWYKYTAPATQSVSVDAIGTDYDQYIAVWTGTKGNLTWVACNDETFSGYSELSFTASAGITYYIEVAQYNDGSNTTDDIGGKLRFNAYITNTDVRIGNVLEGRYFIPASGGLRRSFINLNNGPVEINNVAGTPIIAAERVIYNINNVPTSFSEMMGLPNSQLNTTYWFPWYNNVNLDTQLRFGNVSGSPATVRVFIGGAERPGCTSTPAMAYPFVLAAGQSVRVSCPGLNSGPVEVRSNINIVAAERTIYKVNNVPTSFSEMMGLPNSQLNTTYWFPWYNNVNLDTQLRFGNVSTTQTATVRVFIGGTERPGCIPTPAMAYPYVLGVGQSVRVSCPGMDNGPVEVRSNINIVAAERVIYKVNNVYTSFSEMMGLPNSQLDTTYWMPWYNNVNLETQLRIGNVSASPANVTVTIGGASVPGGSFSLGVGASTRVSFTGIDNGPVKIESTQNIVAAERVIYKVNNVYTSFSEMMGLPNALLNARYWMPWYNNVDLDTQLRFALP